MKKILLIIFIAFYVFQMAASSALIIIGMTPKAFPQGTAAEYTYINRGVTATGTGTITRIEMWVHTNLTDCKVATFYLDGGNFLTARDVVTIGAVASGAKRTFTEDSGSDPIALEVEIGDYIGFYASAGSMELDISGEAGKWFDSGDQTACINNEFGLSGDDGISLLGTGGETDVITVGVTPADFNNVSTANFTGVNKGATATQTGTITTIEMWVNSELSDCKVATFFLEGGDFLTARDVVTLGTVTVGEHSVSNSNPIIEDSGSSPISLEIEIGDVIGIFTSAGTLERATSGGANIWYIAGDETGCTNLEFSVLADDELALRGIGEIPSAFPIAKFSGVVITKWNTKEIVKWNTIE